MINRGGEKIAPREIDDVLLQHPAVAEAVAFGIPHAAWGEEVAAAVVLKSPATEKELVAFARERLADHKVPKKLYLVEKIPRTATGKIQRRSVDPGGVIARSIPEQQVVGCVVYPAATIVAPGVVEHEEGDRFSLGEPDGAKTERLQKICTMLSAAGFKAPAQSRLRNEIWLK